MPAFLARRHADPVEVAHRDSVPTQFLWHGRLYVVREVLDHWLRSGAWWRSAALTRLTSGESATDCTTGAGAGAVGLDDEREFWRVEAAPRRSGAHAVVELCHALASGTWTVTAIHD
jgi:Family of unknown function (DUF6504)